MIQLSAVTKSYEIGRFKSHTAIADVTLDIAENRITVLQGPSGSGKTTLLSLVGAMARPTSGRIIFHGKEITSLPERFLADLRRHQVGFVFQSYNLIKGISVLENVMLPAFPLGDHFQTLRNRAIDLLTQLHIHGLAAMPVQHLSGGEQQRVAIARALINRPRLLIADEPTAHLDSALSEQFMAIMTDLKHRGHTVLVASHDPLVCRHNAIDTVVTLHDGRLVGEPVPS